MKEKINGAINIAKYYESEPDGNGYTFHNHLENDLLTECIKANYTLSEQQDKLQKYDNLLKEIDVILSDFHLSTIRHHVGMTHEIADKIDYYVDWIRKTIWTFNNGNKN